MLRPFTPSFALASLLVGLTATAQVAPAGRPVVLTGKAGESPLIYVAPGTVTVILLGAPILREFVQVEGRARFAVFEVSDQGVTLAPAMALAPGERLALRVTYREGSPASVVFLLTGQPGAADGLVTVSRPQTVEACRVELSATRERCEAQAKELEALKARPAALSPAAVALAGFVNEKGMTGRRFDRACYEARGGELRPVLCRGLGGATWSVVILEVSNTGGEPWAPAWAEVTPPGGEPRRARAVLSGQAAIPPGGVVRVAVEVEMPAREEPGEWLEAPHSVRVCNGDGSRCLSISQVTL